MLAYCGPLVLAACGMGPLAAAFPVLDGDRQATIVHEDGARDEAVRAHRDLAAYLKKATGKTFAAVAEKDFKAGAGAFPIYVGLCRALSDTDRGELQEKMDCDARARLRWERTVAISGTSRVVSRFDWSNNIPSRSAIWGRNNEPQAVLFSRRLVAYMT